MAFDRAVAAVKDDLAFIPAASRWCYNNGYQPLKPNRDRPTPLRDPNLPADFTPGATFDIGVGDYLCRTGWTLARQHLIDADRSTATIVDTITPGRFPATQLRLEDRDIGDIPKLVNAVTRRVTLLAALRPGLTPDIAEWVADALTAPHGPFWAISEARTELTTHHHRNGDMIARQPTVIMCTICRAQAAAPRAGGKCHRCEKRLQRAEHDGYPRAHAIAELRSEAAAELEAAKQRRVTHGPGYGAT